MENINSLDLYINDMLSFLSLTHPSLTDRTKNEYAVEIRPIMRGDYDYKYSRSLNLWKIDETSVDRLKKFLQLHSSLPVCLYYSVFTYDYDENVYTKEGKKAQKGKITSSSSKYTEEIVLDFDNVDRAGLDELLHRFEILGINALWVFSGHGYQAHILLDAPLYDKDALTKAVYKFKVKGFDVDLNCVDPARVMRLPYTYNCKGFTDSKYEHEKDNPPFCEIVNNTISRYSFEYIMEALNELPSVGRETLTIDIEPQFEVKKVIYPYIDKFDLPEPINKMLRLTPQGYRNKTLGFLVKYLKTYLKLSKSQIEDICIAWGNNACEVPYPNLESEINRFYYHNGLPYDSSLSSYFGYIDFQDHLHLQKQYIFIPNGVMTEIDGKLLKLYIAVKLLEHTDKNTTIDKIASTVNLTERAVRNNLKELLKTKHLYTIKGNRTKGIPNQYLTNKLTSLADGFLKLSYNDARGYINDLGIGELKLYLYMSYKFYSGECFMSQTNLGESIGINQNSVSMIIKELLNKDYIKITRTYITEHIYYNNYTLLR